MKATHAFKKEVISETVKSPIGFILSTDKGNYLSLSETENISRYQGLFSLKAKKTGWTLYKFIENICLQDKKPDEIINHIGWIERKSGSASEKFYLCNKSLIYEVDNFDGEVKLEIDCREIYDYDNNGRTYKIYKEKECLIIEYIKFKDNTMHKTDYKLFLAVKTYSNFKRILKWIKAAYKYDKERVSEPSELFIFDALRFRIRKKGKFAIAFSDNKEDAIGEALKTHNESEEMKKSVHELAIKNIPDTNIKSTTTKIAYANAVNSLNSLVVNINDKTGIFAGLPWFFQWWTRDEAISLKALMLIGRMDDAKTILLRHLGQILDDGRVANIYPPAGLGSADGIGWVFKRVSDYLDMLVSNKAIEKHLNENEAGYILDRLQYSTEQLIRSHNENGLAVNNPLETWMDTAWKDDTRSGARIEIQALRLKMYNLMAQLLKIKKNEKECKLYRELESDFKNRVKKQFWKKDSLIDGIDHEADDTIRPNIFLAYYVYPGLLEKKEWIMSFKKALPKLWLKWGGLSSIDKTHPLFFPEYSGENNRSYHRGDSWFFINNIAAICMHRLDRKLFRKYIEKILKASEQEILFQGMIGNSSEVSSASVLSSKGCLSQAWSSATFIELIHELQGKE